MAKRPRIARFNARQAIIEQLVHQLRAYRDVLIYRRRRRDTHAEKTLTMTRQR
jgi:hypothetical protein